MTTTPVSTVPAALPEAIADVQAQMGRVDSKASMLLAGSLASISVGVALIAKTTLPAPVFAGAAVTVVLVAAAVALLITAVRPALGGNHGFVRWASAPTPTALLSDLDKTDRESAAYQALKLLSLSRSLHRKYRHVQRATDLLRAALAVAMLTAAIAAFL